MTPWLQLSIRLSSLECLGVSRFFTSIFASSLSFSLSLSLSLYKPLNRPQTRSRIRCPLSLVFVHFFFVVPTRPSGISSLLPLPSRADSRRWNDVWMAERRGWENLDAGRRMVGRNACTNSARSEKRLLLSGNARCMASMARLRSLFVRHREWKWNASRVRRDNNRGGKRKREFCIQRSLISRNVFRRFLL